MKRVCERREPIVRLIRESKRIHGFPSADVLINAFDRGGDKDEPILSKWDTELWDTKKVGTSYVS